MHCGLCDVASGRVPALVIYEDDAAVAFLGRWPVRRGHTLVIPRLHVADVMSPGADQALAGLARAVAETSRRLIRALGADGLSIVQSNGQAAGQEVFHLHQHLIPRWKNDSRLTVWDGDESEVHRLDLTYSEVMQT